MAIVNGELNWPGHYLSAYGIAQKQGYAGTEEEWLDSLKGADVELRYHDGLLQWKHDEAETWNTLNEFTTFQADIARKAENAQGAADRANASAKEADKSTAAANTAAGSANAKAAAAQGAADSANAAAAGADAAAGNANTAAGLANEQAQLAQGAANRADAATELAKAATSAANSAAEGANASKAAADIAAQNADTKAAAAQAGASAANTAATSANNAATAANSAATSATAAAQNARTQGDYAKGQGDRADELLGKIEETDVGGMAADILALQNGKADKTAVEAALAAKADQTAVTGVTNVLAGKADLENGKVPAAQLPEMDYDPSGSATTVQAKLDVHTGNKNNPHGVTAVQVGLGKALTLTGAVSASYNGTTARTVNIPAGKRTCRFVIGTSTAGWTANDCDYLCDGVDDQEEINAAIQTLPEGGGSIFMLSGTYSVKNTIVIDKPGVSLKGQGASSILSREWSDSSFTYILQVRSDDTEISCLTVIGNKNRYSAQGNVGVLINGGTHVRVNRVSFRENSGDALQVSEYSSKIQITNCLFNNNKRNGITTNLTTGSVINQNIVENSGISGIEIGGGSKDISAMGNISINNDYGITLAGANRCSIVGNICLRGTGLASDYSVAQSTITLFGTGNKDNLIADNHIFGKNYTTDGGSGNTFINNKYN